MVCTGFFLQHPQHLVQAQKMIILINKRPPPTDKMIIFCCGVTGVPLWSAPDPPD